MELDELQKSFLELQDNFKKLSEEKISLEKRLEEVEEKNKRLQDTNHELFLRVTSPAQSPNQEQQDEKKVTTAEIVELYKKEKGIND